MKYWPLLFLLGSLNINAAVIMFDDKTTFELASGAVSAGDIPQSSSGVEFSVGVLDFKNSPNETLNAVRNWSTLIDEEYDLAIDGPENFDIETTASLFAFGFDFHEPSITTPPGPSNPDTCNTPICIDSTFQIQVFNGAVLIGSEQFQRPDDTLTFVGLTTTESFNRIEIREIVGNSDNEFFGNFLIGTAVPAPGSAGIVLLACLIGIATRRGSVGLGSKLRKQTAF